MMVSMIKMILIIWLVGIHAFALLAAWDTDLPYRIDRKLKLGLLNPPEITRFYDDMLGSHLQLDGSVEPGSVIFLGDSLTQALNVTAITPKAINYGIGMDTSLGLLQRISHYQSLSKASRVVIAIGLNDLLRVKRPPEAILENYQRLLDQLLAMGVRRETVVIQALLPVDERISELVGLNAKIRQTNALLQPFAEENGYLFVSAWERFVGTDGNLQKTLHVGDGLHLSDEGHRRWIEFIKGMIMAGPS